MLAAAFADRAGGIRDSALLAAAGHPLVKPIVARVTERRLLYFTDGYVELGHPKARARRRATMLYLSYIGVFDLLRLGLIQYSDADLRARGRELLDTLVTLPGNQSAQDDKDRR